MILPDVEVLVHAYREDAPRHERYRHWLEGVLNGSEAYGRFSRLRRRDPGA